VQAGLISCHAGPAHLSRFAVTRRQQHPSSRFPSPVPERRRHHPCCRCRHHTTPHHTTPTHTPTPPPPLHPTTGEGDSFLPRSRPQPRPRSPSPPRRRVARAVSSLLRRPGRPHPWGGASGGYLARLGT
jgi:hypothetical protein